ncbi:hypothetical protein AAFP30_21740 [Gordonia sp. CPCC 205515]|uniref:three-helix bundle dimerization domain-containing protein n=1 Tax=Gordonia sp. CPCC 205515 TaxID=3140791 RepID=UPI003AF3693B
MHGGNEQQRVEAVVSRLMTYFPDHDPAEVSRVVDDAYRQLAGRHADDVAALLVEHRASKALRAQHAAAAS